MAIYIVKPWYKKGGSVTVVPFSTGTDEEIAAMLDAYYANKLTWAEMGWAVGDTRLIHIDGAGSSSAQDITAVILAHDHTKLATPINGHNNACITVQFREVANMLSYANGDSSYDMNFTKWANLYLRTWLNGGILNRFTYSTGKGSGTSFKDMIKPSKHYRHTSYGTNTSEEVTDTLFLPSHAEIFGTSSSYSYYKPTSPTEGTQFAYFATYTNRKKYNNDNGSQGSTAKNWWTGSPSSNTQYQAYFGYAWLGVDTNSNQVEVYGHNYIDVVPTWAM